jgi:hypothetical protein
MSSCSGPNGDAWERGFAERELARVTEAIEAIEA